MNYYSLISSMLKATVNTLLTGLYAVYKAESNANDSLGIYNGTAQGGLTYTAGKSGNAFLFNGTSAYLSLPDNAFQFPSSNFTISIWIYPTSGSPQVIFNNYAYSAGSINKGWQLAINNITGGQSGKITFSIPISLTNSTDWQFTTTALTNNAWNNIILTRVSSVNTYCWVNGISQSYTLSGTGANITTNPTYHTTQYNTIGASKQLSGVVGAYMLNGSKIDEVYIYNRQLTTQEIIDIYNTGTGKFYPTF